MVLSKSNLKFISNLKFKYLSLVFNYSFFFILSETKMKQIDCIVKILKLMKIKYQIVNNFKLVSCDSMGSYSKFLESSYLIVYSIIYKF